MSNSNTITIHTTKPRGGSDGETFCDTLLIGDIATATISEITTWGSEYIYALKVQYRWNHQMETVAVVHGDGGEYRYSDGEYGCSDGEYGCTVLTLDEDEFVTGVEGFSDESCIYQLTFITNNRRYPSHGAEPGTVPGKQFQWGNIRAGQETKVPGMRLLAFSGRTFADQLAALQGIFIDPRESNNYSISSIRTAANYEGTNVTPKLGETGVPTVPFSTFASHLIAPVITLYIGPDRLELHAHEDTLCKLPFFHAALKGSFRESHTKSIAMPEDAPIMVSALIEYLYTGNYTYTYDLGSAKLNDESGVPVATLTEGQYHVGILGVASKYDCQELVAMVLQNFEAVLLDLDTLDTLRLWTTAYAAGLDLKIVRESYERCHPGNAVRFWVKELFEEHREEIDSTIAQFPEFASELLRLATSDED